MSAVAVLGTGRMGSAMARALARDGHALTLYNRHRERADALADEIGGGRVVDSPAEASVGQDVVLSMVADDRAVDALFRDLGGVLEGLEAGTVAVDASTVRPSVIRSLEAPVRRLGAGLLDAPVSGSVALAEAGELTLMVGGEAADLERARPVLESLGTRVIHVGPLGAGATIKLAVNALIFGINGSLSEALVLAERAGVERSMAYEVFATSAAAAPYVLYKRAAFERPEATPVAFSLDLAAKDLGLILDLARGAGVEMPQAQTNLRLIEAAASSTGADRDVSTVAVHLRGPGAGGPMAD